MEPITTIFFDLLNHIYWELVVGIVLAGQVFSNLFKSEALTLHKKWIVFILAVLGGIVYYLFHDRNEPFDVWRVFISLGVAVTFYDYIVKLVTDALAGKNPFKDYNP